MAYILHLSTIDRLVRTREDHLCRGARNAPNEGNCKYRSQIRRTGIFATEKGDQDVQGTAGTLPYDRKADATGT